MERVRRPARVALILLAALASLLPAAAAPATAAHATATFGTGTSEVSFGRSIRFAQPISLTATPVRRVELLVEIEGDAGPRVREVRQAGELTSGTLEYTFDLVDDHIYPNSDVVARFRITAADGHVALGPEIALRYLDDRFDWQTVEGRTPAGSTVRVHWYDGDEAFGRRALEISQQGVTKSEVRLGVTERDPIDFYIYSNDTDFYGALGPGTRENVGGVALAEIRTLFAQIRPGEIDDSWVEIVIPHELAHLVFHTAVDNPYHEPPRWLNEGLAVYESEGYTASDRLRVGDAIESDRLIPLVGLGGLFPTTYEQFALAYAESVSAVDFMVREHGSDALVRLVRSYADGITDDEAFEAALGMSLAEFDAAWQRDLGVDPPTEYGPQPAPPGPLPSGWTRTPERAPAATTTPSPGSSPGPSAPPSATGSASASQVAGQPTQEPTATGPGASATAAAAATGTARPSGSGGPVTTPTAGGGINNRDAGYLLAGLALILAVVGIALILNSRRASARR